MEGRKEGTWDKNVVKKTFHRKTNNKVTREGKKQELGFLNLPTFRDLGFLNLPSFRGLGFLNLSTFKGLGFLNLRNTPTTT